jgi:hypothetical protein
MHSFPRGIKGDYPQMTQVDMEFTSISDFVVSPEA